MGEEEVLKQQLKLLEEEHQHLDETIHALIQEVPIDQLRLQRLKKRKLWLKDEITELQYQLYPDIIA